MGGGDDGGVRRPLLDSQWRYLNTTASWKSVNIWRKQPVRFLFVFMIFFDCSDSASGYKNSFTDTNPPFVLTAMNCDGSINTDAVTTMLDVPRERRGPR